MKVPKGMTEEQVLQTIQKVVRRVAHKYKFGYYDYDDICQEGFLIAIEGLERYDGLRPLENFLAVHVSNRLKNFKRDNFCRQEKISPSGVMRENRNNSKRFLMEPLDISNIRDDRESKMRISDDFVIDIENKEIVHIVNRHMDISMRSDYLRMLDGVYVPKPRRVQILASVYQIVEEYIDEEG
jgi:DNA-directed RNA polymerase specialized sigma subunit